MYYFERPNNLFQKVQLEEKDGLFIGKASHSCGCDMYHSEYKFFLNGAFEILHKVRGPKKNYISKTHFKRTSLH